MEEDNKLRISYGTLYKTGFLIILLIVIVMLFKWFSYAGAMAISSSTGNAVAVQSGDVQIAKMKAVNGEYVIEPNSFKVGQKVRIEADMSQMPGCSKSIVIREFNVRKTLKEGNNVIEFTPDKAGTFFITCSMNMYQGTFNVLDNDGTKVAYVEKASTSGESCGASGGGCGCGE